MPKPIYLTSPKSYDGTHALAMIDFRLTAEAIDYQGCDTLMFTSKQAVLSADAIDPDWKTYPTVAIGAATAAQIEALGGTVLYHPKRFYGETLAQEVLAQFRSRDLLYLRPRVVSFDSRAFLAQAGYDLKEQIIYETFCRTYRSCDAPPPGAIVIFTSPSTIRCFLEQFPWREDYTAVVIGEATLKHLPSGARYRIAPRPLIDACVQTAREIAREA
jgi:uroporphyrinogen-III synthase